MDQSDGRPLNEPQLDPYKSFLVSRGKLDASCTSERDDRVYNAAMSCIDLALRPYERRLLNRAIHDAERLETLSMERPFEDAEASRTALLSPPEFREFLTIVEREVQRADADGPIPALFRSGALLIAASYLWEQEQSLASVQDICHDLRASLRLLEDLLNWVEAGKRGDRIETLQEAQSRFDGMQHQVESQHAAVRSELKQIAVMIGDLKSVLAPSQNGSDPDIQNIQIRLQEMSSRLAGMTESQAQQSELETMRLEFENRLTGLAESNKQLAEALSEIATLLRDDDGSTSPGDDRDLVGAVDQLRTLMLIGLVGIAVVVILAFVAITVS